jgi:hypothetical protein
LGAVLSNTSRQAKAIGHRTLREWFLSESHSLSSSLLPGANTAWDGAVDQSRFMIGCS